MNDGMKWENGKPIRPLSVSEVRSAIEEMVAIWVDAHHDHESGTDEAQTLICDLGEEVESMLPEILNAAKP